jgi:hypothetical protein
VLACLPLPKNLRVLATGVALLLGACFDPDPTPLETESVGLTDGSTTTGGTACEPGDAQACTCEDGGMGTQTCAADGSGFGACACEAADSTSTTAPPDTDTTTGPPPECMEDGDCAGMAKNECQEGVCTEEGTCMVQALAMGTPCGDDTETECSGPDACDGRGSCSASDASDGSACTDCPLGACSCLAGACGDCTEFAPENNFITTRSIEGWTLTGGWGLYREAPQSFNSGPVAFGGQVFGTDGNRAAPYPSNEDEASSARSAPMMLPATLQFSSWNVDEGSGVDTKQVRVSNDGGATFITLVDCTANPMAQPFCQFRDESRAPDDWDSISIPLPPELVGDLGVVEFTYDTLDSCCSFEKGWFIDVANFATECACIGDEGCADLGGDCGAGVCGGSGECELDAVAAGTDCGDATDVECNAADACDGGGYCSPNLQATGLTQCEDCPAGAGNCNTCQAGACTNCLSQPANNDFGSGSAAHAGWLIEDLGGTGADWQIYSNAPANNDPGSMPVALSFAPSFGTDGNRQAPYPGLNEVEHSRVTTTPDMVPAQITFASWNVDEGSGFDNKTIELSVDGGMTWTVLVDCPAGIGVPQPFCNFRDATRLGTDWDNIVLDTAAFVGQVGQLRFTYNTGDSCCSFERGWFIDNLSFAQYCQDSPFP